MAYELDLTGRRALVTGAGQGVGEGIARALATAGAEVAVNDVSEERARAVASDIGGQPLAVDVTDFDGVMAAVESFGRVDILVNNAGNAGTAGFDNRGRFADSTPDDWARYLGVNLYGVMHCCRAVLPGMVERRWGRLITIVSDSGRTGEAYNAAYSASKAGAGGLMRSLALENGRFGITANSVALGTMRTPATDALWSDPENEQARAMMKSYVVRRPGLPQDVAGMVVLLASEAGSWITGQTYPLNGGFSFGL
jgi:3-oxoacyl-[acyl-carrier protein] reductase